MNNKQINDYIFDLLSEPLKLHKKCTGFTLTVSMDDYPLVEQTYYCDKEDIIKTADISVGSPLVKERKD